MGYVVCPWSCGSIDCFMSVRSTSEVRADRQQTFGEQPCFAILCVLAQVPAIAKVIVALNEFNPLSLP